VKTDCGKKWRKSVFYFDPLPSSAERKGKKMRLRTVSITGLVIIALLAWGACATAQTPSAGLERVHTQKGITCEQCHDKDQQAPVPVDTCLGCHGSYQKLGESAKGKSPNAHDSHLGEIRCTLCHHVHKASENYCSRCHTFELRVP
jgi:hypothetical protein